MVCFKAAQNMWVDFIPATLKEEGKKTEKKEGMEGEWERIRDREREKGRGKEK